MPPENEPLIIPAPEGAPRLHHQALHVLYHAGLHLPRETPGELLQELPHDTLAADLCAIMQWGLDNYSLLSEKRAGRPEMWAPVHAYFLAGAVERPEVLPCLLRMLAAPEEMLDFFFGDMLTEECWWPVRQYMPGGMDKGLDFLAQPGAYEFARTQVLDAMMYATEAAPESRAQLMLGLMDLVPGFLQRGTGPDFDDRFVATELAIRLIEHGGEVGIAVGKQIFDADLADVSIAGDFEDVLREKDEYASHFSRPRLQSMDDLYESLSRYRQGDEAPDASGPDDWQPAELSLNEPGGWFYNPQMPIVKEAKTGRNDPCPCGSGKKYKKCCLGKA